jgi:hypothetical protein
MNNLKKNSTIKKFIFLFFITFNGIIHSQEINGEWKVISYEDEIVYYNKIKDSIRYKDFERKTEADSFKEMADLMIFSITYKFNDNKMSINFPMMDEISGIFENDKQDKKIIFTDDEGKIDEFPYAFENGTLFIEMKMENGFIKIGLNKN